MFNLRIRAAFAGLVAGMVTLFAPVDAGAVTSSPSVCETGYRGMPEYDRECLVTGDVMDGVNLWFREYDGERYGKRYSAKTRRAFCRDANQARTTRAGIVDGLTDVAYDSYRNYRFVLRVAGTVGVLDCEQLGIKIKK